MECREARTHLLDYRRGRLKGAARASVEAHLGACAACRHEEAADRELSAVLDQRLARPRAPDALRRGLHARWGLTAENDAREPAPETRLQVQPVARKRAILTGRTISTLFTMAAGAAIAVLAMRMWPRGPVAHESVDRSPQGPVAHESVDRSPQGPVAHESVDRSPQGPVAHESIDPPIMVAEAVNDYLRVLYSAHPIEVEPGIHQVKPWFEGRLDFAPVVAFAGDDDFPLQGGSVGWFVDRKAATLLYKRRLHLVTLFVFPAHGLPWPATATGTEPVGDVRGTVQRLRGFNVILWQKTDLGYALVSDVDPTDLRVLAGKIAGS
jgi:anti-sigma factor RsiW